MISVFVWLWPLKPESSDTLSMVVDEPQVPPFASNSKQRNSSNSFWSRASCSSMDSSSSYRTKDEFFTDIRYKEAVNKWNQPKIERRKELVSMGVSFGHFRFRSSTIRHFSRGLATKYHHHHPHQLITFRHTTCQTHQRLVKQWE